MVAGQGEARGWARAGVRAGVSPSGGADSVASRAPRRDCTSPCRSVRAPFDSVNNALRWDVGSARSSNKLFSKPTFPFTSKKPAIESL